MMLFHRNSFIFSKTAPNKMLEMKILISTTHVQMCKILKPFETGENIYDWNTA